MNKVLLVVDYQNDFVNGVLGFEGAENLDDGITNKVNEYHNNGDIVIETHDTHVHGKYEETTEGRILPIHTEKGKPGWETFGKTKQAMDKANAILIEKPTFPSIELFTVLQDIDSKLKKETGKGIEVVEVAGLDAAICVVSNVVITIAALPNAKIIVHKELIDSGDKEAKAAAIKVMQSMLVEVV